MLNNSADVELYSNRSLVCYFVNCFFFNLLTITCSIFQSYRNICDPTVQSDGFSGFMEKRLPNGTFIQLDPTDCSPQDTNTSRACSLQANNENGFFESSSWEYSFFAPHDTAHLIELMGGNVHLSTHLFLLKYITYSACFIYRIRLLSV